MSYGSHIRHFRPPEFDSPDRPGSGAKMDPRFIALLDLLRERCGFPFTVNSGYRTKRHNTKVGGTDTSAHLTGHAADIKVTTSRRRHKLVREAVLLGFRRIGIGKTFIHLDNSPDLPQPVIWLY